MNRNSMSLEQFKKLCQYNSEDNCYYSKTGQLYIDALKDVFNLVNRNDIPFLMDEVNLQPKLSEFSFSGKSSFIKVCDLKADVLKINGDKRKNERIKVIKFMSSLTESIFKNSLGVAYILTCYDEENTERIIKIGQSRTTFKDRLSSYNCGTVNNWRTASTTNIKILQSFVATQAIFSLYLCDCSTDNITFDFHGVQSSAYASPKSLAVEEIMIKKFIEQFDFKPLGNVQINPTSK